MVSLVQIGRRDNFQLMRDLLLLAIHLLVTLAKFLGPGGVRRVAAESLLLRHQLLPAIAPNGCVRIAQQIAHAFGIEIDKDVVRRVLSKHFRPEPGADGPSWLTLIAHAKDSVWSVDLFRVESILLRSHWVMLVMDVFTRRIIGFGIAPACIDGVSVCRMFNCATAGQPKPKYLSTDHDPLFRFHRWLANLRVLEVEEIKSVPYAPVSHPFVERLIGTIRREYLDRVFFWNAVDLARKLKEYEDYYNAYRVHRSLGGTTPAQCAGASSAAPASLDRHAWRQHCRGLFQTPIAA